MSILTRYVLSAFLVTFSLALLVFTFVMSLGVVFKVVEWLAMGGSAMTVLGIFLSNVPEALGLTIPMSALTASLLVFGRLSADGEVTAMRACGVSVFAILRGPLLVAVPLTVLCLWLNGTVSPAMHLHRRTITESIKAQPLQFFTPGTFVQNLPGLAFYIGEKNGEAIRDVIIYDLREPGLRREIRAVSGRIVLADDGQTARLELRDVRIDPMWQGQPGTADTYSVPGIPVASGAGAYVKTQKDMGLGELLHAMNTVDTQFPELTPADRAAKRMRLRVEVQRRAALSSFCLCFVVLGIPLGLKGHRRESSIGIGVSLGVVCAAYAFILLAESLASDPAWRPDLLIWVPSAVSLALGLSLLRRAA